MVNDKKLYPDAYRYFRKKQFEAYVWYVGDPYMLHQFYSEHTYGEETLGFWEQNRTNKETSRVHTATASDIAQTSASLLFAKPPIIRIDEKDIADTVYTEITDITEFYSVLTEAAELCAACGGVFLKLNSIGGLVSEESIELEAIPPHNVYPIFHRTKLAEVYCFDEIATDTNDVTGENQTYVTYIREHRYLKGKDLIVETDVVDASNNTILNTKSITGVKGYEYISPSVVVKNYGHLGVVYVPNRKPNSVNPASQQGRSDYEKCYTMMAAFDEIATNWIRDIRLGKSIMFIDGTLLETKKGTGVAGDTTKAFRSNTEAYVNTSFDSDPAALSGKTREPITSVQAEIRSSEFSVAYDKFEQDIIRKSGYSIETFGHDTKSYMSTGSHVSKMERRTSQTLDKKQRYWVTGIKNILKALELYGTVAGVSMPTGTVTVDFADGSSSDIQGTSEAIRNLRQVQALSTHGAVKMQHPEWTDEQVEQELDRIEVVEEPAGQDMNFQQTSQEGEKEAQDAN